MTAVFDSSAMLAALFEEPGSTAVEQALPAALMSAVNLAEVVGALVRRGMSDEEAGAVAATLPVTVIAADSAMAIDAGLLRRLTEGAGLSLGDRFCLALARRLRAPILTADRAWRSVAAAAQVEVVLIR